MSISGVPVSASIGWTFECYVPSVGNYFLLATENVGSVP